MAVPEVYGADVRASCPAAPEVEPQASVDGVAEGARQEPVVFREEGSE